MSMSKEEQIQYINDRKELAIQSLSRNFDWSIRPLQFNHENILNCINTSLAGLTPCVCSFVDDMTDHWGITTEMVSPALDEVIEALKAASSVAFDKFNEKLKTLIRIYDTVRGMK